MLKVEGISFEPVVKLPPDYEIYDFSQGYDPDRTLSSPYGIGKYNEHRPEMYAGEQFVHGRRDIHIGIDIGTPVGESVHAFYEGQIYALGDNALPWDYGPTIISVHSWLGQTVYALHGHLSRHSLECWSAGDSFQRGEVIGWVGDKTENGGWNPHLHFQLSLSRPETYDMPGVVSASQLEQALKTYPDPRLVLGPLYE